MSEVVLRELDAMLKERVQRVAQARGWNVQQALAHLIEQGLYVVEAELNARFTDTDAKALQEAIAALEGIPNDPGFSLIGRVGP